MAYTNSPMVTYTRISPHKTVNRNHKIDRITIHCIVGQWTAKEGCDYFATCTKKASANYIQGKDGSVGLCVEEKDRAWTSSSSSNDNRAVTIECASDKTAPYAVTDTAMKSLIKLCADICKRNGINKMYWFNDKTKSLNYQPKDGEGVFTVHRWFAATECPGGFLMEKMEYIKNEVNKLIGNTSTPTPTPTTPTSTIYRIRKSWADASSQIGAYSSLENAKRACPNGYYVFDENGNIVYPLVSSNGTPVSTTVPFMFKPLVDLDIYKTPGGAIAQSKGAKANAAYTIVELSGDFGKLKSGAGWVYITDKYVKKV